MQGYLHTMDQFLATQEDVVRAYLMSDTATARLAHANRTEQPIEAISLQPAPRLPDETLIASAESPLPLLGDVVAWIPGEELVTQRTYDVAEDLYLRDHTFGRDISAFDADLSALAVMPLTMSLEILAEAATALMDGRTLVQLCDVRAHRWLAFDERPHTLQVSAHRLPGGLDRVRLQLRDLTEDEQSRDPQKSPVLEATALFAAGFPPAPPACPDRVANGRPSTLRPERLYIDGMFHGRRWQGVSAIDQTAEHGAVASLTVMPSEDFFLSLGSPRFVLDPIALDAAGQVIGFWTLERLASGKIIFPFRLETLELYGPPRPVGEALTCLASIELIGEHQIRSDIDLVDAEGHLWMRLVGWEDKRFDLPVHLYPLLQSSPHVDVSSPWSEPMARFAQPELFACRRVAATFPSDQYFWTQIWASRILSRREREDFRRLHLPEDRRIEWLGGRAVAKEAIRDLLRVNYALNLRLADIEIFADDAGRPLVVGAWQGAVAELPSVSLAHTRGCAVALAGLAPPKAGASASPLLGIDIELIRPTEPGFAEVAFADVELELLARLSDPAEAWSLRAWCAKEAVAKALGLGLVDGPKSVTVVAADAGRELLAVALNGQLAHTFPDLAAAPLLVYTDRDGDLIVAATQCERLAGFSLGAGGVE
jgi:phosphopantetheinyl transferase (holo-ACP synthase)